MFVRYTTFCFKRAIWIIICSLPMYARHRTIKHEKRYTNLPVILPTLYPNSRLTYPARCAPSEKPIRCTELRSRPLVCHSTRRSLASCLATIRVLLTDWGYTIVVAPGPQPTKITLYSSWRDIVYRYQYRGFPRNRLSSRNKQTFAVISVRVIYI